MVRAHLCACTVVLCVQCGRGRGCVHHCATPSAVLCAVCLPAEEPGDTIYFTDITFFDFLPRTQDWIVFTLAESQKVARGVVSHVHALCLE